MVKFGKWLGLGAGWALGGPIGGLIGMALGSLYDAADKSSFSLGRLSGGANDFDELQQPNSTKTDFALSLMVLIASVMKADGKILKAELNFVRNYLQMQFGEQASQELTLLLRDLLKRNIPIEDVCNQIRRNMDYSSRLQLIHLLFGIAKADGEIDASELNLIEIIALYLDISMLDKDSIKAIYFNKQENYAYKILEIDPKATDAEVKKAYKKMALKYHPDKVSHLGAEIQASATEKFKKMKEAYEKIKKERGMK